MVKEQVLILKVRYEDEGQPPHTWNWSEVVGNGQVTEVMNHGAPEKAVN